MSTMHRTAFSAWEVLGGAFLQLQYMCSTDALEISHALLLLLLLSLVHTLSGAKKEGENSERRKVT